ncbi:MAG: ABC transporter ATP-binding protein [Parvularculales bacterium]
MPYSVPASIENTPQNMRSYGIIRWVAQHYIWPERKLVTFGVLTNIGLASTAGAIPWLIQQTVDSVFGDSPSFFSQFQFFSGLKETFGLETAADERLAILYIITALSIIIISLRSTLTYIANTTFGYVGQKLVTRLQKDLFNIIIHADLIWLSNIHSGKVITHFTADIPRMQTAMVASLVNITRNLLIVIALYVTLYVLDWQMALLVTVAFPLSAFISNRLAKRSRKSTGLNLEVISVISKLISESLNGIRIIKAYGREKFKMEHAHDEINKAQRYAFKVVRAGSASAPSTEAILGFGVGFLIFYGGYQSINGNLTTGEFTAFITAVALMSTPMRTIARSQNVLQEGVAAAQRVITLLSIKPKVFNAPDARPLKIDNGALSFEDVHFDYPGDRSALHGINFTVPAGRVAALVGPSGGGKSTILGLVPRFYDPQKGAVVIDGQDLRQTTLESTRTASAIVTQDPVLFDDTIYANIADGNPQAPEQDIITAARDANAHDFISALPNGYHTVIGEGGTHLSGGQRQRIAIARALVKNAPILLLDEATSALDTASELQIQKALEILMKGRTTLIIAHRLSTVKHADYIFVVNQGRIVESGNHDTLLKAGGLYAELCQSQLIGAASDA